MRIIYSIALVVTNLIDSSIGSSSSFLRPSSPVRVLTPPLDGHHGKRRTASDLSAEIDDDLGVFARLRAQDPVRSVAAASSSSAADSMSSGDESGFDDLGAELDRIAAASGRGGPSPPVASFLGGYDKREEDQEGKIELAKMYALERLRNGGEAAEDQKVIDGIVETYGLNIDQAFDAIADAYSILDLERVMAEKASLHDDQERLIRKAKNMIEQDVPRGEILASLAEAIESPYLSAKHIFGLALTRTIHPVTPDPARVEEVTQKAIAMIEAGDTGDEDVLRMISTEIQNPKYVSGIFADAKGHVSYLELLAKHREEARIQEDKIKTAKLLIDERFAEFEIINQLKKQFPGCDEFEASHILSLANASNFKSLISNRERLVDEARSRLQSSEQMWEVKAALDILKLEMNDPTLKNVPLDDIIREAKLSSH